MTSAPAVLLAAAAGLLLVPDPGASLRRLGPAGRLPVRSLPTARGWWLVAAGTTAAATLTGAGPLALAVAVASGTALRVTARRARRRQVDSLRTAVLDLLTALAAELRSGHQPRPALVAVCGSGPAVLAPVAAAARSPVTDPARALEIAAQEAGAGALADLAVTWRVAADTGAGLAAVVDRVAATARSDAALRREIASQLAGPRATAALLAGLPLVGVGLGALLGADPLGFLLGPRAGRVCLLASVLLVAAGTAWTDAIARHAEAPP